MKDSFIFETRYKKQVSMLTDEQAGILLKALLAHETAEALPEMDGMTEMLYSVIEEKLDYYSEKYEATCAKRAEAGRKGQEAKKANADSDEANVNSDKVKEANADSEKAKEANAKPNEAKQADTDSESDTESDTDSDTEKDKKKKEGNRLTRFCPPSPDEVVQYCSERGSRVDPDAFMDFYTSKGWKVGNQPMKDWKAAVRTWEKRDKRSGTQEKPRGQNLSRMSDYNGFDQRTYDYDELKRQLLRR